MTSSDDALEMHHLVGGSVRSDELTNVMLLCSGRWSNSEGCHQRYGPHSEANFGCLLFQKWYTDRANLSWYRMALLAGRFLPEPKPDELLLAEYIERTR